MCYPKEIKIAKSTDINLPILRILGRKLVEEGKIRKIGELYYPIEVKEKARERQDYSSSKKISNFKKLIKKEESAEKGKIQASISPQKTETEKIRPKKVTVIGWSATILFFLAGLFSCGKFCAFFIVFPLLSFLLFGFLKGENWARLLLIGICCANFWWILPLFLIYFCDRPMVRKYFGAERTPKKVKMTFTNIIRIFLGTILFIIGEFGIFILIVFSLTPNTAFEAKLIFSIIFTLIVILFFVQGEKLWKSARA